MLTVPTEATDLWQLSTKLFFASETQGKVSLRRYNELNTKLVKRFWQLHPRKYDISTRNFVCQNNFFSTLCSNTGLSSGYADLNYLII